MTSGKRLTVICCAGLGVVLIAGFVYLGMSKLGEGLRTASMGNAQEVLVGAIAGRVLAPGVDGTIPNPSGPQPLPDEYQHNPTLAHKRYMLVITWIHASKVFKAIRGEPPSPGLTTSSATVTNISAEDRVDAWGNPYCILAVPGKIAFLSSGGNGALDCAMLDDQATRRAATKASDSRLTKEDNLLIAVYSLSNDAPLQ